MGFGRVCGDGVGVGGAGGSITPAFAEDFDCPVQIIFSFPFLENESARAVLLVSRRLDPIQPIGRITVSGLDLTRPCRDGLTCYNTVVR